MGKIQSEESLTIPVIVVFSYVMAYEILESLDKYLLILWVWGISFSFMSKWKTKKEKWYLQKVRVSLEEVKTFF